MAFRKLAGFLALVNVAVSASQPSKVLIATGWGTEVGNGITDTEIIDLYNQANVCDTQDYPLPVQGAVGDLVGDVENKGLDGSDCRLVRVARLQGIDVQPAPNKDAIYF